MKNDSVETKKKPSMLAFVLAVFGLGLLLWSSFSYLGAYLSKEPARRYALKRGDAGLEGSPRGNAAAKQDSPQYKAVEEARAALKEAPEDIERKLRLGELASMAAIGLGDGSLLVEAVQQYSEVLKIEPDNKVGLKGLATISFRSGVFDKALQYYTRYLELEPGDLRAYADFTLVKLQTGSAEEAKELLGAKLDAHPKSFPLLLASAVERERAGDKQVAIERAVKAGEVANGEAEQTAAKMMLSMLRGEFSNPEDSTVPSDVVAVADKNPKQVLEQLVQKHSILGPKIQRIEWTEERLAKVYLNDFPVSAMPPVARQRIEQRLQTAMAPFAEVYELVLLDDSDSSQSLSIRSK